MSGQELQFCGKIVPSRDLVPSRPPASLTSRALTLYPLPQPDPAPQGGSSSHLSFSLLLLLVFGKPFERFLRGLNATYLAARTLFEFAAWDLLVAVVWGRGNPQHFAGWLWRSWVCCPASAQEERSRSGCGISMSEPFLVPLCTSAPVSKLRCFAGCLLASFVFGKSRRLRWEEQDLVS